MPRLRIFDTGDADGRPYFTMEFVEGGSLAQRLAGAPQPVVLELRRAKSEK